MQLTILLLTAMLLQRPATAHLHPHTFLTTPEIIRARGYPAQTHHVTTSDGYVLQMHRIPGGRGGGQGAGLNGLDFASSGKNSSSNNRGKQKVAFLQHCVLCSSADFILNDPDQAIAFILADLGYDVWLGNIRGNVYSRRHVRLSPNQPEFWDYSIDEIARYDVPAMLTYVREATGSPTLSYVGHSMGTSVFFAMMNYHPQINNWVRVMAAMAPVAYIHNARIFQFYAPLINALEISVTKLGIVEFLMNSPGLSKFISISCSPLSPLKTICSAIRLFLFGLNSDYVDKNYQSVILAHNPAGISSNVLRQYLQFNSTRRFQAFDRGAARNQREYGSASPPRYSLARVTVPVGLFWSDGDWLVDSLDVRQTASELPRVALNYRVPLSDFNHNDFLWAENAKDLVYGQLVRLLEAHN
ncbi:lipase 3-like isoform X1 [Penaeus chinensis]|uniref:lipase 3-like isoform X1 n=1 Tax=Penaeus chinensis TaxID=139456 RepID=UPI001FB684A2|nr:lipase 3-like isoform X1 [Penaeus chinensis]